MPARLAIFAVLLAAPAVARADSYAIQTVYADGLSDGALGMAIATATPELGTIGVFGMVFATPIIHVAHGNIGRGLGSFGLRTLTVGTGLVSLFVAGWRRNAGVLAFEIAVAAILGLLTIQVIDAAVLAED